MKSLELFCGKAVISSALAGLGFHTMSLDCRKRSGVCIPDFHMNIMDIKDPVKLFGKVDVIWASPPCQCWSNAPGTYHFFEGKPQTESTKYLIKVLEKTLAIIEEMSPAIYFIENPRGKLRYYKKMTDFLVRTAGMIKLAMYSDYGFQSQKPTNIFTNCLDLKLHSSSKYGRGATAPHGNLNNLTVVQRQQIPRSFAESIARQTVDHLFTLYVND